jgi:lactate dehydrogenase-like 2-hydroxyacid dehydrogenase
MKHASENRQKAYVARYFTAAVEAAIAARFDVVRPEGDQPVAAEVLVKQAQGCTHLFVSATERLPEAALTALAPTLKVVATLSVGHDHIALDAARRQGVAVLTTPDVLSAACAEIALMLILNAARRGYEADTLVRSGAWGGWAPTQLLGLGLVGRRLGILGMGRIGREVAVRAASFGMICHYHNRSQLAPDLEGDSHYHHSVDELMRHSDVLCLCAPGGPSLVGTVNASRINLLPKNPIVVNISRGDLVDDDALIDALKRGRVFAAGLDVFRGEPAIDQRFSLLPNVFLTPHIGSATTETRDAMGLLLIDGIDALARGETPENQVI